MAEYEVTADLAVEINQLNSNGRLKASLHPSQTSPAAFIDLNIEQRQHGVDRTHTVQLQVDGYGGLIVRVVKQDGIDALVVDSGGQLYP